jgi:hypothetical protein
MGTITKPTVRDAWADNAIPTTDIIDPGNPFVSAGWPLSSTPPARQIFNWVLNYCMNGIRYLCQRGIPDWDSTETYAIGGIAIGSDGQVYQSLVNGNTNLAPPTSPAAWGPLKNYLTAGAASATFETISDAAAKLAQAETFAQNAANAAQGAAQNFATNADATVLSAAESFASNAGNLTSGTLPAARLPSSFSVSGTIAASAFGTPSDENLKEGIESIDGPLDRLEKMRGVTFTWRKNGVRAAGTIAQGVQSAIPEGVHTDDDGHLIVDPMAVVGVLIEALKEERRDRVSLEARLAAVEAR